MPVPEFRVWDGEEMIYVKDSAVWSLKIERSPEWTLFYKSRRHCRTSSETRLMQYIGMEDADGKQIFEADVLQGEEEKLGLVWWNTEKGRYYLLSPSGETVVLSQQTIRWEPWRVAGNVHETPHLMDPDLSHLLRHLKGQMDTVECPVCGGTDFEMTTVLVSEGKVPCNEKGPLAVDCTRCHHVMLFHTDALK